MFKRGTNRALAASFPSLRRVFALDTVWVLWQMQTSSHSGMTEKYIPIFYKMKLLFWLSKHNGVKIDGHCDWRFLILCPEKSLSRGNETRITVIKGWSLRGGNVLRSPDKETKTSTRTPLGSMVTRYCLVACLPCSSSCTLSFKTSYKDTLNIIGTFDCCSI